MDSKPHILLLVENDFTRKQLQEQIAARSFAVSAAASPAMALEHLAPSVNLVWLDLSARNYDLDEAVRLLRKAGPLSLLGIAPAPHAEMRRRARNAGISHVLAHEKLEALLDHLAAAASGSGDSSAMKA